MLDHFPKFQIIFKLSLILMIYHTPQLIIMYLGTKIIIHFIIA